MIGVIYFEQGRYPEALEVAQEALSIARTVNHRSNEGKNLNLIGLIYDGLGRYNEALEVLQQSLSIRGDVDDRRGESRNSQ